MDDMMNRLGALFHISEKAQGYPHLGAIKEWVDRELRAVNDEIAKAKAALMPKAPTADVPPAPAPTTSAMEDHPDGA